MYLSSTLSHLHSLQAENCDRDSRRVMDEDLNGKFWVERARSLSVTDTTMVVYLHSHRNV